MSQPAYLKKVAVSDDAGVTWYPLPATSPSIEIVGDVIDDTNLATNAGYRTRLHGLHDWSASVDSNLIAITGVGATDNASGATAIKKCREAKMNRTGLKFRYLPTGAVDAMGLTGNVLVETFALSGDVGGIETVAISLQANGALAAAA